jgi:hypothetical protein
MPNASNVLIGQATISIDGTDIGYTKGGTTLRRAVTWVEVKADQHPGVVRMGRSEERLTIKTTLLEGTLENLRVALGYPSSSLTNGGNTLTLGDNNVCSVEEHEIVLTAVAPGCGARIITLGRCVSRSDLEYVMKRDEETGFEVEFEVLKDNEGHFGTIVND